MDGSDRHKHKLRTLKINYQKNPVVLWLDKNILPTKPQAPIISALQKSMKTHFACKSVSGQGGFLVESACFFSSSLFGDACYWKHVWIVTMSQSACVYVRLHCCCSLILGGLLGAMKSDVLQSNDIQGEVFYDITSLLILELMEHCSAHFHTYCLFCLLWMQLLPRSIRGIKHFLLLSYNSEH